MQKVITFVLCLALILGMAAPAWAAELSEMAYEELIQLRQRLDQEIVSRPEWKEVTVPPGRYTVGIDIPAGSYSIRVIGEWTAHVIVFGSEYGDYSANGGLIYSGSVDDDDPLIGKLTLKNGYVIDIGGSVVFAPPVSFMFN